MTSQLLAATTTGDGLDGSGLLALTVLAFLGYRLALIGLFPFASHKACNGSGKRWGRGNFRPCHGCKGTGRRLRLGRRIWNWTRETT